jgi:hypothetical protein
MFLQRLLAPPCRRQRGARHQRHGPVDEVELLDEEPVVTGQVDLVVEPPVGAGQRLGIPQKRAVGLHHVAQDLDLLGRGMLRGELGGQPLKLLPHGVKLGHLRVVERGHDQRPAVAGQQALRLKPLQGFAHRGAADAETLGQFAFDQPVARAVDALVDRVEN